jgi:hypothetical protein
VRQFIGSVCLETVQWQRLVLILALLPAMLALNSCGGGSSSTTPSTPTLTISCSATSVVVNGTATCTQSIANLSSTLVNWEAGGVAGGNSTFGTIDTNGKYTAPQTVPSNNVVTITAIAQAQTTLTATATITILPATAISAITCLDSTQTPSLTVKSGTSLACTATSSANTAIAVTWEVDTIAGGNAAVGKISAQGNYVAPLVPPAGGTVTITAISQAVSTQTMTATVNVTFGNRVLQQPYAFSVRGRVIPGNTFFARAGSFTAGGDGTLTGNLEDYNQVGQAGGAKQLAFKWIYSIGPDGRGTMEFCENVSSTCTLAAATAFFRIVVVSPDQAQMIEFSAPGLSVANSVGIGEMDSQDTTVSGTDGLAGVYSFNFSGLTSSAAPQSEIGEFDADGHGSIAAGSTNNPATPGDTPGRLDINGGGEQFLSASSYSISSNGRGTATIGSSVFNFYLVSANRAKFIEADTAAVTLGDAFKQQVNPSSPCSWGNSALNNAIVFETSGIGPSGGLADLVSFTGASSAGLATSTITDGAIDENSGGTVPPPASSLSGNFSIDACGRGTLNISTHSYVLYLISPGNALIQETTAGVVAEGVLVQPQVASFAKTSLSGSYAFNLTGTNAPGTAGSEVDFAGQFTADGSGAVTSGSVDTNNFGATQTGVAETGTYLATPVASATAPPGTLRATISLATGNFVTYQISPTQFFALGANATGVTSGSLYKQF